MADSWPHIRVENVWIKSNCDGACGKEFKPNERALLIEDIDTLLFICRDCLTKYLKNIDKKGTK